MAAWSVTLVAALAVLHRSGGDAMALPTLSVPGRWSTWLEERGPLVAAFALLRALALSGAWYLVVATTVGTALRLGRSTRLVLVSDALTPRPLRHLLAAFAGAGLVTSAAFAPAYAVGPSAPANPPPPVITMHRLAPGESPPSTATTAPPPTPAPGAQVDQWVVRRGECFWTIAAGVLGRAGDRRPTNAEIVPYWQRLIDANATVLVHPGDANLIVPGQILKIPAPPAPPGRSGG